MKLVKTTDGIRAAIKSICNRGNTLQNDIQRVALAILEHIHEHGDWTLAVEAIEGISANKGVKSAKLTQYFEAMMGATYAPVDDRNAFTYDEGLSHADIDLKVAEAVKWYDFKTPSKDNSKELDEIPEAVMKLIKKSVDTAKLSEDEYTTILEKVNDVVTDLALAREFREDEAA